MDLVHRGKFLNLVKKDGWEYTERSNASGVVGILAVTEDDEILLVEQFRIPVDNDTIEIPAGLVGDDERWGVGMSCPKEAARRELMEETGYEARFMTELVELSSSPGMTSETTILFRAEGLKKVSDGGGVGSENIKVHKVRIETLDNWLEIQRDAGYLLDAKLYASLRFL